MNENQVVQKRVESVAPKTEKAVARNITTAEMIDDLKNIDAKELASVVRRLLQDKK